MKPETEIPTKPPIIAADKLAKAERQRKSATFLSLDQVTRPTVSTEEAAFYLNRQPQTLRCWAMGQTGPLNPLRINARLAWSVAELRALLGVTC